MSAFSFQYTLTVLGTILIQNVPIMILATLCGTRLKSPGLYLIAVGAAIGIVGQLISGVAVLGSTTTLIGGTRLLPSSSLYRMMMAFNMIIHSLSIVIALVGWIIFFQWCVRAAPKPGFTTS